MANIGEIFVEYWQKTARLGPAQLKFEPDRPARPSPLKFAGRNGPARFVKPGIYNPDSAPANCSQLANAYFGE